jgi:hypothetical protein
MNTKSVKWGAIALSCLVSWQANAVIAYSTPTTLNSGNLQSGGPFILGNMFSVNSPINVTAIGAYDRSQNGFSGLGVQVAIYSLSGSTWSLVSGTLQSFLGSQPGGSYVGDSSFKSITPVSLALGTYAIVAANYGTSGNQNWNANLGVGNTPRVEFQNTSTAISMTGPNSAFYGSGATLPGTLSGLTSGSRGTPYPSFGAGNFDFTPVPEASEFAVIGVGVLGLLYLGRAYLLRFRLA